MNIGHKRWLVQGRCQGIHVVKKQGKNQQDSIPWYNVLQTVRPTEVIKRWNNRRWGQRRGLVLPVHPIGQGVGVELVSGGVESRVPVFLGTIE